MRAAFIEATGSRSKETSRNRFGNRPATAADRLRAIRAGRHEHGTRPALLVVEQEAGSVAAVVWTGAQ